MRRRAAAGRLLPVRRLLARVGRAALGAGARRARSASPTCRPPTALAVGPNAAEATRAHGRSTPRPTRPAGRADRPDRHAGRGGGLRRPRALVGGRRRAPPRRPRSARAASRAVAGRRWPRCASATPRPRDDRTRRERAAGGGHAPGLRAALPDGHERVAFVCGAWHAPALDPTPSRRRPPTPSCCKGLPKVKVAATWVPWTSGRLARQRATAPASPRPAGTSTCSPPADDADVRRRRVAGAAWPALLRDEQLDGVAGVGHRGRPPGRRPRRPAGPPARPGWPSSTDATQAVLCGGSPLPLRLVADRLSSATRSGAVPADTPMVPLAADLGGQQRALRLKPSAAETTLDARPAHRRRSRPQPSAPPPAVLDVDWGDPVDAGRTPGTFKEAWTLEWQPELAVALIEASGYGTTVAARGGGDGRRAGRRRRRPGRAQPAWSSGASWPSCPTPRRRSWPRSPSARPTSTTSALLMAAVEPLARTLPLRRRARRRHRGGARACSTAIVVRACGRPARRRARRSTTTPPPRVRAAHRRRPAGPGAARRRRAARRAWRDAAGRRSPTSDGVHGSVAGRVEPAAARRRPRSTPTRPAAG